MYSTSPINSTGSREIEHVTSKPHERQANPTWWCDRIFFLEKFICQLRLMEEDPTFVPGDETSPTVAPGKQESRDKSEDECEEAEEE